MVEQYKAHAAECMRLARQTPDPIEREELINQAAGWLEMAKFAETINTPPDTTEDE